MGKGMKFPGMPGMGGMGNMQGLMQRVQKMQGEMQKVQEEIAARSFTATAGGGVVSVTVTGKKQVTDIKLDPAAVDPDDVEMLQDLLLTAVNDALNQVDAVSEAEMNKVTGGLKLPGM